MKDITLSDAIVWTTSMLVIGAAMVMIVVITGQLVSCSVEKARLNTALELVHPHPSGCREDVVDIGHEGTWRCEPGSRAEFIPWPAPHGTLVCRCDRETDATVPTVPVVNEAKLNDQRWEALKTIE